MNFELLPYAVADGARNMAADETLLVSAGQGRATLRFYGWSAPTVSLGYFQQAHIVRDDPRLATLPLVRRPTGGAALVHHHELTYALAVPLTLQLKARSWMADMHRAIAVALENLGLQLERALTMPGSSPSSPLCFTQPTAGDLLHGPHKLLGSSQRKHHQALLQHGALLLAQSPFTPTLPGIKELTAADLAVGPLIAAIVEAFQKVTGFGVQSAAWSPAQEKMVEQLAADKYGNGAWNEKR